MEIQTIIAVAVSAAMSCCHSPEEVDVRLQIRCLRRVSGNSISMA